MKRRKYNYVYEESASSILEKMNKQDASIIKLKKEYEYCDLYSTIRGAMISAFQKYMKSEEWKEFCEKVKTRENHKCKDCNISINKGDKGVVHHENYIYFGMANYSELSSCVFLCKKCHHKRHQKMKYTEVPFWAKREFQTGFFKSDEFYDNLYMNL